jgi:multiple sugar transport system substrate-binding protein
MSHPVRFVFWLSLAVSLVLSACGGGAVAPGAAPEYKGEKVTITVWDYYTDPNATPIKPALDAFAKAYPNITVNYQIMDWQTTSDKLDVALSGGTPPDVATVDMTWLPRFAALGAFVDLKPFLSNGQLNGLPLDQNYTAGSLEAMTYGGKILTMMYDFDVYALYYRSDLLEQKGLAVPKTWDELVTTLQKLGTGDKYKYEVDLDTFHAAQFIFENGGALLSPDDKTAAFNAPAAAQGFQAFTDLVTKSKVGIAWTADQGEAMQGIKDERIAMFSNGPYFMGLLKSGAPEMAGKWKVAPHPFSKGVSSYLGGTGLVIPTGSKNQAAAWKFIEFLLKPENAVGVYKYAGAAPALLQALNSPDVDKADDYFGGQKTLEIFREAMKTAHPFPYVRQWSDIDGFITNSLQEVILKQTPVQQSLDDAAAKTNASLAK